MKPRCSDLRSIFFHTLSDTPVGISKKEMDPSGRATTKSSRGPTSTQARHVTPLIFRYPTKPIPSSFRRRTFTLPEFLSTKAAVAPSWLKTMFSTGLSWISPEKRGNSASTVPSSVGRSSSKPDLNPRASSGPRLDIATVVTGSLKSSCCSTWMVSVPSPVQTVTRPSCPTVTKRPPRTGKTASTAWVWNRGNWCVQVDTLRGSASSISTRNSPPSEAVTAKHL